ncbi:molybdate ABC transporter substrate-binding protein [Capilliphycus salinus ALCB114379]|uniref:molybdate ABC transporter substrate-binding protein n=1 Tax=Capilliphycus salinus TaxID=2768948 RepID=UPI0039A43D2A
MIRREFLIDLIGLVAAFILFVSTVNVGSAQPNQTTLTVAAGAGLKATMEAIQQVYSQTQPNVKIIYIFAASGALRQQIEQGAPVDVFISASSKFMDELQSKGLLLNETRRNLLTNQVALIVPQNMTGIYSFQDLTKNTVKKIAIGEPRVAPVGKSAEEVLTYFNLFEQLKTQIIYAKDALQIVNYVATGNVDAGIVHDTTAKQSNQVKIVAIAPPESHEPLVYPVAVIKDSKNVTDAREFVNFLSGSQAKSIFEQHGYQLAR